MTPADPRSQIDEYQTVVAPNFNTKIIFGQVMCRLSYT